MPTKAIDFQGFEKAFSHKMDVEKMNSLKGIMENHETELELTNEATYLKIKGRTEKVWIETNEHIQRSVGGESDLPCATSEVEDLLSERTISKAAKVQHKSKYFLGSTIVNVVFLSGPKATWTKARKAAFTRDMIDDGHTILNRVIRNDTLPMPVHSFVVTTEEFNYSKDPVVVPVVDPADPKKRDYSPIGVNIKSYLKSKGVYDGNVNDVKSYANQPEVLQAFYEHVNELRDTYSTDWGYLVFVIPDSMGKGRAHAKSRPGFFVLFEKPTVYPWTTAHETLHMFGAGDEYVNDPTDADQITKCRSGIRGLYDIPNSNCATSEGNKCMMSGALRGTTWRENLCTVSARQLSLIKTDKDEYQPNNDYVYHKYSMRDGHFKNERGILFNSDVIRKNRRVWIKVDGKSKMHPWYNEHGPEGDTNTIVGSDHLLSGHAFSCVIGRWVSLDGKKKGNWFYVGAGGAWFTAPYTGYFQWNINDKKSNFNDNSGNMNVHLWTKLPDNYGPVFVYGKSEAEAECSLQEIRELTADEYLEMQDAP